MKKTKKSLINIMNNQSMKLFTMLCGYFILILVLYTICQIIKFKNCLSLVQIISIVLPLLVYMYSCKKNNLKETLLITGIYLFLLVVFPFIWSYTYDLSYDGNSYQKTAVAYLKNGWNPLYEKSKQFQKNNDVVVEIPDESKMDIWIEHYPKSTWITAAVIYNMTNNIESGKCITIILLIMTLIITYNCLRTILDKKWSLILSILLCFNPITLSQIFTYYVDCLMGFCFVVELLLLFLINPMEKQNKLVWLSLLSICTFFTNIKFTGLLYSGVIAAVFYFYWFFKYRKEKDFLIRFRNITLHFIAVFVIAIFFVGSTSYVKNTIEHTNPLYPLFGADKIDIITKMQPSSFKNKSILEKFAISLFSKTDNISQIANKEPELKLPFMLYKSEFNNLEVPDLRIAGFGPLFALAIVFSIIIFIICLTSFIKKEIKNLKYIIIPATAIILSMILVGEIWWARYIPQFYIFPIGTIVLALHTSENFKNKFIPRIMTVVLSLILLLNSLIFTKAIVDYIQAFNQIEKDLIIFEKANNLELRLAGESELCGYFYNLKDKGIKYTVLDEIKENEKIYKYYWRFEVKNNEEIFTTN